MDKRDWVKETEYLQANLRRQVLEEVDVETRTKAADDVSDLRGREMVDDVHNVFWEGQPRLGYPQSL